MSRSTRLVLASAILLALASGALAYFVAPDPINLWTRLTSEKSEARLVRLDFEGTTFEVPDGMIARVKRRTFGPVQQIDLVAPWPFDPGKPPSAADSRRVREWTLLQFEPVDARLSQRERFERIYVHYFSGPPVAASAGLVQYDFTPKSPYADMQLFVDRQADPPVFLNCDTKPSSLGPVLCERRMKVTDRITLRYRFPRDMLERWVEVDKEVKSILDHIVKR
ncbi:MAG: hypothetical protein AB7S41_09230 [Parvibaculaceae bacterium]